MNTFAFEMRIFKAFHLSYCLKKISPFERGLIFLFYELLIICTVDRTAFEHVADDGVAWVLSDFEEALGVVIAF